LIYNKGQGEVNKAKVIIIFCNRDKTKSPVGYEKDDEIIIERVVCIKESKNKFKVNNKIKTSS
jgi:structural maintenance of chromosome 2